MSESDIKKRISAAAGEAERKTALKYEEKLRAIAAIAASPGVTAVKSESAATPDIAYKQPKVVRRRHRWNRQRVKLQAGQP